MNFAAFKLKPPELYEDPMEAAAATLSDSLRVVILEKLRAGYEFQCQVVEDEDPKHGFLNVSVKVTFKARTQ